MTHKKDTQLHYSLGVVIVLIGVLYLLSLYLSGGKKAADEQMVQLTPVVEENAVGEVAPENMYLGMKTWTWVSAKDKSGSMIALTGEKPFTLSFDFNSGKYTVSTDCNSGGGLFAAKSGVVQFGDLAMTEKACEGSQEAVFTGLLSKAEQFYFTSKGEMVLDLKGGGTLTFK